MSDSDNSPSHNDSDVDIYKDFEEFNFEDELVKLEGSKESYKQEAIDLSEKVKKLTKENEEFRKLNEVLKKNLSTLLKTAQTEVQRKDNVISELRAKVDSFTFRRNKRLTKDVFTSTDDLEGFLPSLKENASKRDKNRSKSHENRSSSESEHRFFQDEKKRNFNDGKEENFICDKNRKLDYFREKSKSNSRHSDNCLDRHREKDSRENQSYRYRDKDSTLRKSDRHDQRNNFKFDSLDRRRKSDESRFPFRRKRSRERRRDESSDRRKRKESRKDRSCSRERSKNRNSLEKTKNRHSLDKDSVIKAKDPLKEKSSHSFPMKNNNKNEDFGKQSENFEKEKSQGKSTKLNEENKKNTKDKQTAKNVVHSNLEIFNAKSPLDALYSEPMTGREPNRFLKLGTTRPESEPEEGEFIESNPETTEPEDWALSFKNERRDVPKPVTLYSKRMMEKFSAETKKTETQEKKKDVSTVPEKPERIQENIKKLDEEKEPGELTDDENIVESSKEFQELAKVACIETKLSDKSENEESPKEEKGLFKEPTKKQTGKELKIRSEAKPQESNLEFAGKLADDLSKKEEPHCPIEIEGNKELGDVIEFSPFKNNYKLIEISPIKPTSDQHILDYYKLSIPQTHKEMESSILKFLSSVVPQDKREMNATEEKSESEENTTKTSDTTDEKGSFVENRFEEKKTESKVSVKPFKTKEVEANQTPLEEAALKKEDIQEIRKKGSKEKSSEEGKLRKRAESSDEIVRKGKRKFPSQKENENQATDEKSQKRKRGKSECDDTSAKKQKLAEKNDNSKRRTRSTRDSKSDSEPKVEAPAEKVKEDISFFEFFKPITDKEKHKLEADEKLPVHTSTVTTAMSVTGVVCMETPNKCGEKLKNLVINEQMLCHVMDSKNAQFSPLIGSKYVEMTPRRMLKNDLMLTDSEDDSAIKPSQGVDKREEEEECDTSDSENSECHSDSGASDFVDLL